MVGRFPICFLHLEIPANQVDVNVHPTKSEVRFLDGGEIYRRLLQALRSKFLSTDLTAKVQSEPSAPQFRTAPNDALMQWGNAQGHPVHLGRPNQPSEFQPFADTFRADRFRSNTEIPTSPRSEISPSNSPLSWPDRIPSPAHSPSESQAFPANHSAPTMEPPWESSSSEANAWDRHDPAQSTPSSHLGFQIHNRYLVTQDDSGMVLIDQHALHERILYEQIRDRVLSQTMESQRLLIPEPITLTAAEAGAALEARETLKQIGIEIEPFGGDTILITAYPAMLTKITPAEMVRQVLEPLMEAGKQPEARVLLDSMMNMMSCKAAIKAGDKLSSEEITALLEQRHLFADTHHCPHGRPTALFFSREQLDKMFKRT